MNQITEKSNKQMLKSQKEPIFEANRQNQEKGMAAEERKEGKVREKEACGR